MSRAAASLLSFGQPVRVWPQTGHGRPFKGATGTVCRRLSDGHIEVRLDASLPAVCLTRRCPLTLLPLLTLAAEEVEAYAAASMI
jgi:hypothetical protein